MQIEYELTEEDYLHAYELIVERSRRCRLRRLKVRAFIIAVISFTALVLAVGSLSHLPVDVAGLATAALAALIIPGFLFWHRRYWKGMPQRWLRNSIARGEWDEWFGRWTFTIDAEGIRYSAAFGEARLVWRHVIRLEGGEHAILFYLGEDAPIPVPKTAFDNEAEYRRFAETAARYRKAAPAHERKCPKCGYDLRGAVAGGCPECGWRREN